MRLTEATLADIDRVEVRLDEDLRGLPTLETAAQRVSELLYESFEPSTVLVRVFATVPFGSLPSFNQGFVRRLAGERRDLLQDEMPVLSLMGTRGVHSDWNTRFSSRGHVGIPLESEFVQAIPMIASLMKELGVAVQRAPGQDARIVVQSLGTVAGVFYVEEASSAVDAQARKIIGAQDFVERYGVKSVFGFGGLYALAGTFIATILFCRESVPREQAERFMRLTNTIKASTMRVVAKGLLFA